MLALQALINGLAIGAVYALVGLPVVLIYRSSRVANFAIGGLIVWAGLLGSSLSKDLPLWLAYLVLLVICLAGTCVLYLVCMRFLVGQPEVVGVMVTLAVGFALEGLAAEIYGPDAHSFARVIPFHSFHIVGDLSIPSDSIVAVVLLAIVFVILLLLVNKSEFGRDIRAVSDDPGTAASLGINVHRVMLQSYLLLGLSVFIGAIAIVPSQSVSAFQGLTLLVGTMVGVTVGGMERLEGAVVGGLVVGMLTSLSITVLNAFYQALALAVLVLLVLLVRPRGLLTGLRGRDVS